MDTEISKPTTATAPTYLFRKCVPNLTIAQPKTKYGNKYAAPDMLKKSTSPRNRWLVIHPKTNTADRRQGVRRNPLISKGTITSKIRLRACKNQNGSGCIIIALKNRTLSTQKDNCLRLHSKQIHHPLFLVSNTV